MQYLPFHQCACKPVRLCDLRSCSESLCAEITPRNLRRKFWRRGASRAAQVRDPPMAQPPMTARKTFRGTARPGKAAARTARETVEARAQTGSATVMSAGSASAIVEAGAPTETGVRRRLRQLSLVPWSCYPFRQWLLGASCGAWRQRESVPCCCRGIPLVAEQRDQVSPQWRVEVQPLDSHAACKKCHWRCCLCISQQCLSGYHP